MKKILFIAVALLCITFTMNAQGINIIPKPVKMVEKQGEFTLTPSTTIVYRGDLQEQAAYLQDVIKKSTGLRLDITEGKAKKNTIYLTLDTPDKVAESYKLDVNSKGVTIVGADKGGLFYGIQTLLQLFPAQIYSNVVEEGVKWSAPAVSIEDKPEYEWRGMMLDVARYFYDKEFVKKYIDMMAMYKMNILHLHLIDDSGWRLQIDKYPLLTEIGAWAGENEKRLGGYYTKDDIREIVKYAELRNVEVIPEIAFPAHMLSAVAAYPWLSCEEKQLKVQTQHYISRDLLCVGKESSYQFIDDIIKETVELFPSKYIHIGGDEVVPEKWATCPHCREVMEREGIEKPGELQGYLTNVVSNMMKKYGKTIVGWQEAAMRGKLDNQIVGMVWTKLEYAKQIMDAGHKTVLCPASHTYFDFPEGRTPGEIKAATWMPPISIERCYSLKVGDYDQNSQILGVQGAFWSDQFIHGTLLQELDLLNENRSENYAEYLTFPRLLALSEVAWSEENYRDYKDFRDRLKYHFHKLEKKECHYRVPEPIIAEMKETNGGVEFTLEPSVDASVIRYTTDGTYPHKHSKIYTNSVTVDDKINFRASTNTDNGLLSLPIYFKEEYSELKRFGTVTAKWSPELIKGKTFAPWKFECTGKIAGNGKYQITFIYTGGQYRLDIEGVKLFKRDQLVGEDIHSGSTGGAHTNNTYIINVDSFEAGTPFFIEAMVRGDLGNDSNGVVLIKKLD